MTMVVTYLAILARGNANFRVKHSFSTIFHPKTQGTLERFHKTMKSWLKLWWKYIRIIWIDVYLLCYGVIENTNYIARNVIIQNDWNKPTLTEINDKAAEVKSLTDLPTEQRRSTVWFCTRDTPFGEDSRTDDNHDCSTYLTKIDLDKLLSKFKNIFSDLPGRTHLGTHHILVQPDIRPVKCNAYR